MSSFAQIETEIQQIRKTNRCFLSLPSSYRLLVIEFLVVGVKKKVFENYDFENLDVSEVRASFFAVCAVRISMKKNYCFFPSNGFAQKIPLPWSFETKTSAGSFEISRFWNLRSGRNNDLLTFSSSKDSDAKKNIDDTFKRSVSRKRLSTVTLTKELLMLLWRKVRFNNQKIQDQKFYVFRKIIGNAFWKRT